MSIVNLLTKVPATISYRYLGDRCTGVVVMEVQLPSGYKPCDGPEKDVSSQLCLNEVSSSSFFIFLKVKFHVLKVFKRSKAMGLTQYEASKKSVVFYLNKVGDSVN